MQGISHTGIATSDFERALVFYRDLIGMKVKIYGHFYGDAYDKITDLKNAQGRGAILTLGNDQIELFEFVNPVPEIREKKRVMCDPGISHICFKVSDVDQEYDRLKAAGVTFHCPPQCFDGVRATYGRDLDGNIFGLIQMEGVIEK